MAKKKEQTVESLIGDINQRLDAIEDMAAWLVKAEQRFRKGQRVQFSAAADRRTVSARTKGGVRTGKVIKADGYLVTVLLDGYKSPRSYHHSFFEPVSRGRK